MHHHLAHSCRLWLIGICAIALSLVACDDASSNSQHAPAPKPPTITIASFAQLRPQAPTALTSDNHGRIYVSQHNDTPEQEVVLKIDPADAQQHTPTPLSTASILALINQPNATGHIQSIVWVQDDLYAYFHGGIGTDVLVAIVRLNLPSGTLQLIADTSQLMRQSRMGASIDLAHAQLFTVNHEVYLYLHHSDAWAILKVAPPDHEESARRDEPLVRVFEHLPSTLSLTDARSSFAAGPNGTLVMLDMLDADVWRITPEGTTTRALSLVGLPEAICMLPSPGSDSITLFAAQSGLLQARTLDRVDKSPVHTEFPAVVKAAAGTVNAIGPKAFQHGADIQPRTLRLTMATATPQKNRWIAYDAPSGRLIEISLSGE